MPERPQDADATQERIRQVLLNEWDPIGVSHIPEAHDEYDSYVGGVYRLLASDASEYELIDHLYGLETLSMGLRGNRKGLKDVAAKLAALKVSL